MFDTFKIRNPLEKEEVNKSPIQLIPPSFTGLIVGPPGAGKSRLIVDMLHNTKAIYGKFDLVLFLTPYGERGFELEIPPDRLYTELSLEWIKTRIEQEKETRPIKNALVILDDLVSGIAKSHLNPELIDFFFNRRKIIPDLEISIICTAQKFSLFPAKFRSCLQWIILLAISPRDYKEISAQHIFNAPPHLQHTISAHFRKSYNFVFIKLDKFGIFLNFEKAI